MIRQGGTYIRKPDGSLEQVAAPTRDASSPGLGGGRKAAPPASAEASADKPAEATDAAKGS